MRHHLLLLFAFLLGGFIVSAQEQSKELSKEVFQQKTKKILDTSKKSTQGQMPVYKSRAKVEQFSVQPKNQERYKILNAQKHKAIRKVERLDSISEVKPKQDSAQSKK